MQCAVIRAESCLNLWRLFLELTAEHPRTQLSGQNDSSQMLSQFIATLAFLLARVLERNIAVLDKFEPTLRLRLNGRKAWREQALMEDLHGMSTHEKIFVFWKAWFRGLF